MFLDPRNLRLVQRALSRADDAAQLVQDIGLRRAADLAVRVLREPAPEPGTFEPLHRAILTATIARMAPPAPSPEEVGALERAIDFASQMPVERLQQLLALLIVFEIGPLALGPRRARFTTLSGGEQDAYIASWESSAMAPRRAAFHGLKSVCMMGYYASPAVWPTIGYDLNTERSS